MIELLLTPLAYAFVGRAMLAVTMVASVCALVGTFAVLRGMSYIGTAVAHSLVPGIAVGYLLGGPDRGRLFWWATATAILTSLGMATLVHRSRVGEDAAVGVVYAGMFALGIAIISTARNFAVDLLHFLFGNMLSITTADLVRIAVVSVVIGAVILLLYKELVLVTFDPVFAASLRLHSTLLTYLQYLLIALAIVVALQTIGIALVVTLLVAPAAAALQITRRFHHTVLVAAVIGIVSGGTGLYLSYYLNVASGAAVALVCVALFLLVTAAARLAGLASRRARKTAAVAPQWRAARRPLRCSMCSRSAIRAAGSAWWPPASPLECSRSFATRSKVYAYRARHEDTGRVVRMETRGCAAHGGPAVRGPVAGRGGAAAVG